MAKPKRYSPEQITRFLKQQEAGLKVAEICRQAGTCEQTFYPWKSRYGGMDASEVQRLKAMEDENRRLKQLVGEQALDIQALKAALDQKY